MRSFGCALFIFLLWEESKKMFNFRNPEKILKELSLAFFIIAIAVSIMSLLCCAVGVVLDDFSIESFKRLVWCFAGSVICFFSGLFFTHVIYGFSELIAETRRLRQHFAPDQ